MNSILITNLSPTTTPQTLDSFFSFCGKIVSVQIAPHNEVEIHAIVTFDSEVAAKTALFLNHVIIEEKQLNLYPYNSTVETPLPSQQTLTTPTADLISFPSENPEYPSNVPEGTPIPNPTQNETESLKPIDQKIASFIASAWQYTNSTINALNEVDEKYKISDKVKTGAQKISTKTQELDDKYQISQKAQEVISNFQQKYQEVDNKYDINNKTESIGLVVNSAMSTLGNFLSNKIDVLMTKVEEEVQSRPKVVQVVNTLQNGTNSLSQRVQAIQKETTHLIKEKEVQKQPSEEQSDSSIPETSSLTQSSNFPTPN
jgi:hypothetical protein